jgi:aminopeptidase N
VQKIPTTLNWAGDAASYARLGQELVVTPGEALQTGAAFTVRIAYHGTPRPRVSAVSGWAVGWFKGTSGAVNVMAEPDGASTWFPANDHPSDKALYRFEITVHRPWVAVATGVLVETSYYDDHALYVWEMDKPMTSYLASVNIARYNTEVQTGPGGVIIRNYIPEGTDAALIANLEHVPEMLSYFTGLFGPYPFAAYGVLVADATVLPCQGPFGMAL